MVDGISFLFWTNYPLLKCINLRRRAVSESETSLARSQIDQCRTKIYNSPFFLFVFYIVQTKWMIYSSGEKYSMGAMSGKDGGYRT